STRIQRPTAMSNTISPTLDDNYVESIETETTSPDYRRCTIREDGEATYRIDVDIPPTDDGARWWFEASLDEDFEATVTFNDGAEYRAAIAIEETNPTSGEFGGTVTFLDEV
ncbi:MAG: hypothetical protein ABEN55_21315, partial [Bradymonadaceae bacterium]